MSTSGAMMTNVDPDEAARNRARMANNVLPVLVARAGGSIEVTRAEFEEVAARYGGASKMNLRMEALADGSGVRLTLLRQPARQGELPS